MIPVVVSHARPAPSIPRESGDDPVWATLVVMGEGVFPARAGMILVNGPELFAGQGIPRESGDDPTLPAPPGQVPTYSPRERG